LVEMAAACEKQDSRLETLAIEAQKGERTSDKSLTWTTNRQRPAFTMCTSGMSGQLQF